MLTLNEVCTEARRIPCAPELLPEALKLLESPDLQISDLESFIQRDPGVSTSILKLVNSVAFSGGRVFDNIGEALMRLGMRETYNVLVSVLAGRWASFETAGYGWCPGDFCRHSFIVATASQAVANQVDRSLASVAYTAGLVHDAGKLALALVAPGELNQVAEVQKQDHSYWIDAERKVFGFSHADVSVELLRRWKFPPNLLAVVGYYDQPSKAPEAHRKLVQIVHAGKHISISTGVGGGLDVFHVRLEESAFDAIGLSGADVEELLPKILEDVQKILGGKLSEGQLSF